MTESSPARDWRDTVFLPKTDFPMKAGLPQKEPGILARWQEQDLYNKLRDARRGREKFILHDGPPYANGDMHIGHALNHILKDMVVRTQTLLGKDAPYVPGWDCHGLPIENQIEKTHGRNLSREDVQAKARAYAGEQVAAPRLMRAAPARIMRQRLPVIADRRGLWEIRRQRRMSLHRQRRRLGDAADRPTRMAYKKLTR